MYGLTCVSQVCETTQYLEKFISNTQVLLLLTERQDQKMLWVHLAGEYSRAYLLMKSFYLCMQSKKKSLLRNLPGYLLCIMCSVSMTTQYRSKCW